MVDPKLETPEQTKARVEKAFSEPTTLDELTMLEMEKSGKELRERIMAMKPLTEAELMGETDEISTTYPIPAPQSLSQSTYRPLTPEDIRRQRLAREEKEAVERAENPQTDKDYLQELLKSARRYDKTPKGRQSRQVNFLFPSAEAHEAFKYECRQLGVPMADVMTALVMNFMKLRDQGGLEKMIEAGIWDRKEAGRPSREGKALERESKVAKDLGSEAKKSKSSSPPIIAGIKFPKIPPLCEDDWTAWPIGNVRYLTPEEFESLRVQSIISNQIQLRDARYVDEAGNYFNEGTEVLSNSKWRGDGGNSTTYLALLAGKWCPREFDWRVENFLSFHKDGLSKTCLRHLDPRDTEHYGKPAWDGMRE